MMGKVWTVLMLALVSVSCSENLPGVYEYYSEGGITEGLKENGAEFSLNGKLIHILSGSIHYFRVHPDYWRDRLRKLRAAGFNTVDTYVAWAMHEKQPNQFDFTGWLNVTKFIEIAQEEDLLVILRPGPYICSEFDFGGLPAWLLRDSDMKVRLSYPPYEHRCHLYLKEVLRRLHKLQWSAEFGAQPIIAMQVENEYGAYGYEDYPRDTEHLKFLLNEMKIVNGFNHVLYFTSDSPGTTGDLGSIPGVLQMANFRTTGRPNLEALDELQPGRPKMVAEYWSGWFDHWSQEYHSATSMNSFEDGVNITFEFQGSINYYMFHGGTTHGFWSGANVDQSPYSYLPDTNSYDYDAPLSESGDYTDKYFRTIELFKLNNRGPEFSTPSLPGVTHKKKYPPITPTEYLSLRDLLLQSPHESSVNVISMEALQSLQLHGFVAYTQPELTLPSPTSNLTIEGHIRDIAYIYIDDVLISKPVATQAEVNTSGFWPYKDSKWVLDGDDGNHRLDILVEALGRNNYGKPHQFNEKKGLWEGQVFLDGNQLKDWTISSLEFLPGWMDNLNGWKPVEDKKMKGTNLLKASLEINDNPQDTFLDLRAQSDNHWIKGVVWVNGFNLGRYWNIGPTQTMYIPAPLLKQGQNEILILEIYQSDTEICFSDSPNLGIPLYI